jgi:hypothetical protein
MPQQLQLVIFVLAMTALVVCGCIFTPETVKKITHEKQGSFGRTSARLFRSRRGKGRSLDGQRSTEH